jgi:peptidoglycan/LPS O-acetylase OafA/YrhL
MLGIVTFQRYAQIIQNKIYVPAFVVIAAGIFFTLGFPITIVAVTSAVVILKVRLKSRPLKFFGNISYSLYLLHLPIGLRVLRVSSTHPYAVAALAVCASIVGAYVLYRLVERPAQWWAARFHYKSTKALPASEPNVVATLSVG